MILNKLEAVHQFVSPAKYFSAWRRMSRSWASLACSARNAAFSASNRAILAPGDPGRPCVGAAVAAPAVVPEPNASFIVPSVFDAAVAPAVAEAVRQATAKKDVAPV